MTPASLNVIRHEHRALSAMLRSIVLMLDFHRKRGTVPDLDALQAMLFYVDEFPEKLHHPKETSLLFPKLRGRTQHMDEVLERLDREHEKGGLAIRELEHALIAFRVMRGTVQEASRRDAFESAVKDYVSFYLGHMAVEEAEVLPFAQGVLQREDWAEIDKAFLQNRDPLAGYEADEAYRPLYMTILSALQHSGNFASVLEALAGTAQPQFSSPR
ncbi:hemerythrin domain-containing protein [Variovorax sp. J22R133]|nr:hemerythrin domain-containing protein [Variovorax sp. J22R133]MDM0116379.1 hemerythrin domain-containing protein [Variovorax sp. J22R133]